MPQSKGQKFGGPRYNKPHEVHDKLLALGQNFNEFYDAILRRAFIRWDLDASEVWVEGRFRASGGQMTSWTGLSKSGFYIKWRKLIEAGLIRAGEDGLWVVTMVIRKAEVAVSDIELTRMHQELHDMKEKFRRLTEIVKELENKNGGPEASVLSTPPDDRSTGVDDPSTGVDPPILLKDLNKKNSPSSLNTVISGFYKGIGQKRIAKKKRERGLNVGRKLRKEGFSLEDIAFAVEWTLENAEKQPYDFALIEDTIGQALAAKDKIESERQAIEERRRAEEAERSEREAEKQQRQDIETYKADLNQEQRHELRQKARTELIKSGVPETGIQDFLLDIKENELLRRELEQKGD